MLAFIGLLLSLSLIGAVSSCSANTCTINYLNSSNGFFVDFINSTSVQIEYNYVTSGVLASGQSWSFPLGMKITIQRVVYGPDGNYTSFNYTNSTRNSQLKISCVDSDGGFNIYQKGSVSVNMTNLTTNVTGKAFANDGCFNVPFNLPNYTPFWSIIQIAASKGINLGSLNQTSGQYLFEGICGIQTLNGTTTAIMGESYKCPYGCSNGACVKAPVQGKTNFTTPSCTDSDGGKNYYVKGEVKVITNLGNITSYDSCFNSPVPFADGTPGSQVFTTFYKDNINISNLNATSGEYLMESSCLGNINYSSNNWNALDLGSVYKCPFGCSDGACINGTTSKNGCYDSDGGFNIYQKGSVIINQTGPNGVKVKISATNSCFNSSVPIINGTDSKELINIFIKNNLSMKDLNLTSGEYLMETTCAYQNLSGNVTYDVAQAYKCPFGCSDGMCIKTPSCKTPGIRENGTYCSQNGTYLPQKEGGISCENNFECQSNFCANNQCVQPSIIQEFIKWLESIFG
jgi:hypothetical protein